MSSLSANEDCIGWAARDASGFLSPYSFDRRYIFSSIFFRGKKKRLLVFKGRKKRSLYVYTLFIKETLDLHCFNIQIHHLEGGYKKNKTKLKPSL